MASGPLDGIRIIEIAGIGPGPFAGFMLADLGADIIKVDRAQNVRGGDPGSPPGDTLQRGRRSIGVDLKSPEGVEVVLQLCEKADAIFEPFRPGVAERLGIGPDVALARNPKLVYGRMTGWGQDGPYALTAGHDINYIALAGSLFHIGRAGEPPTPPLNLVGDFGGGGMLLAYGMLAALLHAARTGEGQVVDAAMVDGAASLMMMFHAFSAMGVHDPEHRGTSMLDTGAPFYDTYETADGKYVAVGAIEPQFYAQLLEGLGLADADLPGQHDASRAEELRATFTEAFLRHDRDHWASVFDGTDACVTPVLSFAEVETEPHITERGTFFHDVSADGDNLEPAPAPRFSRSVPPTPTPPGEKGVDTDAVLRDWV